MKYLVARLKEAGTYRVVGGFIAGVLGTEFSEGTTELVFQIISGVILLWEALKPSASTVEKEAAK
jgi:hypothetical protein